MKLSAGPVRVKQNYDAFVLPTEIEKAKIKR